MSGAEALAKAAGNPTVEEGHFLLSLLKDGEGLASVLFSSLGADACAVKEGAKNICKDYPTMSGGSNERPYISTECAKMLERADLEREAMSDEYLSVEHLVLSLTETDNARLKRLFSEFKIKSFFRDHNVK